MATTAHTEVPGGHKAPFPPFQSETFVSQLFWLVIAFAVLYLLTSRLVLPRVGGIIEARAKQIEGDLSEAQQFKEAADAANARMKKRWRMRARAPRRWPMPLARSRQRKPKRSARRWSNSSTPSWARPRRPSPPPRPQPWAMCAASPPTRLRPSSSG